MEQKRTCPECSLSFRAPQPESGVLTCPLCDMVFSVAPAVAASPAQGSMPSTSGRYVLKGCAALGVMAVFVGGLVFAAYRWTDNVAPTTAPALPLSATVLPRSEPSSIVEAPPVPRMSPPFKPAIRPPEPMVKPTPPPPTKPINKPTKPASQPTRIVSKSLPLSERVNRAIDRGVEHLRRDDFAHNERHNYLGLLGLTLLECGVEEKGLLVQKIAAWLRMREYDLAATYELSLAILFLDRLNDPQDRQLIRTFGQRLLGGQNQWGVWAYTCPVKSNRSRRVGEPVKPLDPRRHIGEPVNPKAHPPRSQPSPLVFHGDNSNTQFALLGLWVAQRHGVPARSALLAAEKHFRDTQMKNGSWSYDSSRPRSPDSMTCAGLMSLAMRHGMISGQGRDIRPDRPAEVRDKAVTQALGFLGRSLDKIQFAGGRITGVEARDPLYFLWSLERMAMIYDLRTIGDKEWYPWAASLIVENQQSDGSWPDYNDKYPVTTCFALLVLRRSNLTPNLRLTVQGQAPPGLEQTTLPGEKADPEGKKLGPGILPAKK